MDTRLHIGLAQDAVHGLLDEVGLALLHQQDGALAGAKTRELRIDQGIGDVQHVQRHPGMTERVGQSQQFQRPQHGVVQAPLHHDSKILRRFGKELVQAPVLDEFHGRRPAARNLVLFVQVARRRQHDAIDVAHWLLDRVLQGERGPLVGLGPEAAVHMAGPDPKLQHHRCIAGLGQFEPLLHRVDDAGQVGPRVQQPDLGLHGERVRALLHDAGALAVVLADDQQRAADDAARGEVGQRVGSHVGAHGRLEGHGAAQRVVDRRAQRRRRRRLGGAVLEMHPQLLQDVIGVGQHVHQVRDRRTLVAGNVGNAGLQQRLGHGEDAFAAELVALAQTQLGHFACKRAFGHGND